MADQALLSVLIGPPGAGKSTYARANFPAEWIVTADETRERVAGCALA